MINTSRFASLFSILLSISIQYVAALAPASMQNIRQTYLPSTQLSAWSLPAPTQRSFLSPTANSINHNDNVWYEDYGNAAVDRHVRYQDDEQDDYIWDSGSAKGGVGYAFARIESYETYLAYDPENDRHQAVIRRKPSLLRRGLRSVLNKLQKTQ